MADPATARTDLDPATRLTHLLESQELVGEVVRGFLHVRPDEVDAGIRAALRRLGTFLAVDRVYLFETDGSNLTIDGTMTNTHEWCAPGIAPEIHNLARLPVAAIGSWLDRLAGGEPVAIADVSSIPESEAITRELLEPQGIQSLLVVPMLSIGDLVGFVGFDSVRRRRNFEPVEIALLRSVADVLTSVLVRRRSDAAAERAEQRLVALTQYATDVILIVDDDGMITFGSPSWRRMGFDATSMAGTPWRSYVHPDDVRAILRLMEPIGDGHVAERVLRLPDFRVRTADGTWRWLSGAVSDARHDGVVDGLVVNAHDVTDRRGVEDQLAFEAMHDPLTGLGNRALLSEQLHTVCRRARMLRSNVAVVFLDLDRFKLVNDGHGHAIGDEVLVEVGRRLVNAVRSSDTVARFGGDEFVVLLDGFDDGAEVDELVNRFRAALAPSMMVRGNDYRVTASIGVVLGDGISLDPVVMLRDADTAMYRAKESGRDRVVVFDETLRTKVLRRLSLNHRLPKALEEGLVDVAYQPVVDMVSGRIAGAEALVRWTDSELGIVPPAEFIPVAEETGVIGAIFELVLERAVVEASSWPAPLEVAVNLSLSQLTRPDLIPLITGTLERYGFAASRLCIEVTESSLMSHPPTVVRALHGLRDVGVRTALDDFGTGYSSLAMLRELPIDTLKIDQVFVRGVHHDPRDRRLVDAVISLAADFGMGTLAEGVEEAAQQVALIDAGCELAQGYLFGRPVPAAEFTALIADRVRSARSSAPVPSR